MFENILLNGFITSIVVAIQNQLLTPILQGIQVYPQWSFITLVLSITILMIFNLRLFLKILKTSHQKSILLSQIKSILD